MQSLVLVSNIHSNRPNTWCCPSLPERGPFLRAAFSDSLRSSRDRMSICLTVSYSSATMVLLTVWAVVPSFVFAACRCRFGSGCLVPRRAFKPVGVIEVVEVVVVATVPSLSETLVLIEVGRRPSEGTVTLSITARFSLVAVAALPELAFRDKEADFPLRVTLTDLGLGGDVDEEDSTAMVRVWEVGVTRDSPVVGETVTVVVIGLLLRSRRENTEPGAALSLWAAGTRPEGPRGRKSNDNRPFGWKSEH